MGLPGETALKLGRELDRHADADIVLMGHLHQKQAVAKMTVYAGSSHTGVVEVERKAYMVPSYQRISVGSGEERDDLGFPVVTWNEERGQARQPRGMLRILVQPGCKQHWGLF